MENKPDDSQARFGQTHWTLVLAAAGGRASPEAQDSLEQICQIYWPPLYAYLRRQGQTSENAKDLTQGFFAHLLAGDHFGIANPAAGKFRTFLLTCLKHYVRNERDKQNAEKRGGLQIHFPLNVSDVETNLGFEPADPQDPARIFDHKWAAALLQCVLRQLREKNAACGRSDEFETLQPFLTGEAARGDYGVAAARLKTSEGAVRVAATRLRKEFSLLLRAEIRRTVGSDDEVDDEIRHMLAALRQP